MNEFLHEFAGGCSLKVDFAAREKRRWRPAMVFRILAAAELASFSSGKTGSDSFAVPISALWAIGIPQNSKAALAKIDIRSQAPENVLANTVLGMI